MNAKIVNGKEIALQIKEEIISLIKNSNITKRPPKLVIFYIGYNKSSELYIKYKKRFANECGVEVEIINFNKDTNFSTIRNALAQKNDDPNVDGIMIQLPIDGNNILNKDEMIDLINPKKDVDGLTSLTLGKTWFNNKIVFGSSTALAVMKIFDIEKVNLIGKNIVIIGNTIVLGRPLAGMLANSGSTISILNSKTNDISLFTKNADIIVSATGIKRLLKKEMIKKDAILIDVGTNKDENNKTHGDFETDEMIECASLISPSPGGVGPITIAILILNTVKSFLLNNK